MKKKILFISTANLTTNPRILKEIKLAISLNYDVQFLGFNMNNWSDEIEKNYIHTLSNVATLHYINAGRKPFLPWFISSVKEIGLRKIFFLFSTSLKANAYASNKRSFLLQQWFHKNKPTADLIVAHTLGTLYPVYCYSKKNNIPFAFDVEDYHPGEKIHNDINNEHQRRIFQLREMLPFAKYISCAAPLIELQIRRTVLSDTISTHIFTVNNSFSQQEFIKPVLIDKEKKLNLVWFSQNISFGRGLEIVLPMLEQFANKITVTLIGNMDVYFYQSVVVQYANFVQVLQPLSQTALHKKLAEYDIGLAIEDTNADENRNICLTNKIWSYYQAGLYIIATNTKAQEKFITENKQHGVIVNFSENDFKKLFQEIIDSKDLIISAKNKRYQTAINDSWENETKKLIEVWK